MASSPPPDLHSTTQGVNVLPAERRAALLASLELGVLLDEEGDLVQHVKELRERLDATGRASEQALKRLRAAHQHEPASERPDVLRAASESAQLLAHAVGELRADLGAAHRRLENFRGQEIGRGQRHALAAEMAEAIAAQTALEERLGEEAHGALEQLTRRKEVDELTSARPGSSAPPLPGSLPLSDEPAGHAFELDPEQAARLGPVVDAVNKAVDKAQRRAPGTSMAREDLAEVQNVWAERFENEARMAAMGDPNEMAQWVMRRAYEDNTQDMRRYAMRTQFHTALRNQVRAEAQRARLYLSEHVTRGAKSDGELDLPFDAIQLHKEPLVAEDGSWQLRKPTKAAPIRDAKSLERYVADMEQLGLSVGDDMQVVQIELQAAMQRQQQVMNALSSISKAMHEIAMSILRKIGT